ncbi:ABC transporter ATP-binding protein [Amphritea sp. 2_MG-2023]|uniref:ABC transporter ATP-binding protein n=1 Tax=Amphritea TaxID=515417 RepID=UPI001C07A89B|nr:MULTISPECIES: ABC transporter ATP-binding protein [Amphritea]MBU2964987.1 ABC transporter ATP-binding protein [Amphritea atlantica]MDO6419662.1 ABC transporter ATP-binding protein [Amphritea sp. 2_MG-2023]
MIEIKNLYKRYHNHHGSDWVLKNINLVIPKCVSVGLIGRNGAGKSTLLQLIAGMDTPDKGEVIRHSRVSWPVGLSGGFQGSMTGRQNVKFVARVQGGSRQEILRVIAFVERFAEIGDAFDEPVKTYSSGMRSRFAFGLSLAFDFDVYISDEATAVGDRLFKEKAREAFAEKVGQSSLIMVSHSEGVLKELCEAGIFINDGEAQWYDDINEAIDAYHNSYPVVAPINDLEKSVDSFDFSGFVSAKKEMEKARINYQQKRDKYAQLRDIRNERLNDGYA